MPSASRKWLQINYKQIDYKWWVTVAVTLGMLMSMMDSTIVLVAIPHMQRAFGADIHDVQWVVTTYMLTQAAVIPTAPYLAAKWGGKRSYLWTLTAFLLGSVLCGFAWNLPSLIVFRLIQGIGGGVLLPMVMTLLFQAFPPEERGTASSVMGTALMVAPVLGPVVGGYLVTAFGWQWAFFINVPLGVVALGIAHRVLRETPMEATRFDLPGFVTAALGCAASVYGISALASGDTAARNVALLAVGIISLLAFVFIELRRTRRGQAALLALGQFADRTFAFSVLALVFYSAVFFGILFLIPVYLQSLHGETAVTAGMIQSTEALTVVAVLPFVGRLTDRIGARPIVIVGLIALVGVAVLMTTLALATPIWMIVGILMLLGLAVGLGQQIPVAAMINIEKEQRQQVANGSTLVTVLRAVAAPLGVALLSSIMQTQSQSEAHSLAAQGLTGTTLALQSSLQAMHKSFLVGAALALMAVGAMVFVPRRRAQAQSRIDGLLGVAAMSDEPRHAQQLTQRNQPRVGRQ